MVKRYKKKPIVIEAIQLLDEDYNRCIKFIGKENISQVSIGFIEIKTLEGNMKARIFDYIIKGINGEFYPCKPDVFKNTYDEVKEQG